MNFNITCTIKNERLKLTVKYKQSSFAYFYVYKNNKWIGTLCSNGNEQYSLISYSRFFITQKDINAIGEQISRYGKLNRCDTGLGLTLKAA